MKKTNKSLGIVAIIVIGLAAGVFGYIAGQQNATPTDTGQENEEQPNTEQQDPSTEVIATFQEGLTNRALERGTQPIEGFSAAVLIDTFSGLEESDFDGVQTGGGVHSYNGNELSWERLEDQPILSDERAITQKSYGTLLDNLSERLDMPASSAEEAIAIIDEIDGSN